MITAWSQPIFRFKSPISRFDISPDSTHISMVISGEIRPRAQYFDKMLKFRKTSLKFCSYFAKHSQKIAEILHMFRKFRKTFAKCSHFDDNFGQISKSTPKMLSKCQYLQNFAQFSIVVLSKPKILLIPGSKRGNATIFR